MGGNQKPLPPGSNRKPSILNLISELYIKKIFKNFKYLGLRKRVGKLYGMLTEL